MNKLSDLYPTGSKKWLAIRQAEIHNWNVIEVKGMGNSAPLNMKLEYTLGWLEKIEE